jgi:hypothetical protein
MGDNARNFVQTAPTVTTTPSTIVAQNENRKALIVFNTTAVVVSIGIGTALIPIAVGDHLAFVDGTAPLNAITAVAASSSGNITVWEA